MATQKFVDFVADQVGVEKNIADMLVTVDSFSQFSFTLLFVQNPDITCSWLLSQLLGKSTQLSDMFCLLAMFKDFFWSIMTLACSNSNSVVSFTLQFCTETHQWCNDMQQYSLVWWLRLTATILVLTSWPKIEFHLLHGCSLGELSNKKRYSMCATTLPSLFGLKCPGMAHHGILPLKVEVHNTRIQSFIKSPLLPIKL